LQLKKINKYRGNLNLIICALQNIDRTIRGYTLGRGKKFFSSPKCPDRIRGSFPTVSIRDLKFAIYFHLGARLEMNGALYFHVLDRGNFILLYCTLLYCHLLYLL